MRSNVMRLVGVATMAAALAGCASLNIGVHPASVAPPPAPAHLLYAMFQDHAVLQRDQPIPVWGNAAPGTTVSVSLAGETAQATADADGRWLAQLAPLPAGGPYVLTATAGGASQSVSDIMLGDVWLCSGQSNMELQVHATINADIEVQGAAHRDIRLLQVDRSSATQPLRDFGAKATWSVASPESVKDFSAACYYFGRELQPAVNVPIGLIHSSWGGSSIEAWMSRESLMKVGGYDKLLDTVKAFEANPQVALANWRDFVAQWWHDADPANHASPPWSTPSLDDSSWSTITVAGDWEDSGIAELRNFDGIIWFRTHINVSADQAKQDATLTLGPIDDNDITVLNGVRVGSTEGWDVPRKYTIPAGTLKPGDNVLAVGVFDGGAGGGMYGAQSDKMLRFADGSTVAVPQEWRYRISSPLNVLGSRPPVPPWFGANGTTNLYNGMIAPLLPARIKGVLWYQGESNTGAADKYKQLLAAMIADWRARFGGDLPFLVVQLAGFGPASGDPKDVSGWPELREAQRLTALADPKVGLAIAIDIGSRYTIHPTNKQEVGRRLALLAERIAYGQNVVSDGPEPMAAHAQGRGVVVDFQNAESALTLYGSDRPIGFELCDAARNCRYASGTVKGNSVTLDASGMPTAAFVRFCWAASPICNLYNAENLPAVPFEMAIARAAPVHPHGEKAAHSHKKAKRRP